MSTYSPIVGIHLDLKGVMFKPDYIPQFLADLADQGINAVLVEYEDMFPFEDLDIAADRQVCWTRETLATFQGEAAKRCIEIIPLQQCLGHLEYLYRWNRYRKHALDRKYPSTVDVENPKAVDLILNMLRQIIEAHPDSRYVHVGMDEAHALVAHAKAQGKDVVALFLQHLERLLAVCEQYGKKAIIWSDMLEDHMNSRCLPLFEKFKSRVVISTWDYTTGGERTASLRIAGHRVSRTWLDEPENPEAPTIGPGQTWLEDLPAEVRKLIEPELHGREATTLFQVDMWTRLGFEVLGAGAIRCSSNLAVLPFYNRHIANIRAWGRAVYRNRQLGVIGTSWARGTSWCPPGFNIDLTWPLIAELSTAMGILPNPFFQGVDAVAVERIVKTLGRSRVDWRLEGHVADEMAALEPKVRKHRFEWKSLELMARTLQLQRRASYNLEEVDFFHANHRPVDSEWQRRISEQKQTLKDIAALRKQIKAHFAQRYHGQAFEEWVRDLFDLYESRIKDAQKICRRKMALAKKEYARR